jgi:hypothetical protein
MASTCLEGLLALAKQGQFPQIFQMKKDNLFIVFLSNSLSADLSTCDPGSANGEAGILIQAIMSIKSIITQDPPTHEKVYCSFPFLAYLPLTVHSVEILSFIKKTDARSSICG